MMNAVIKAQAWEQISAKQPIDRAGSAAVLPDSRDERIAQLEDAVAERDAALARAKSHLDTVRSDALREGEERGHAAASQLQRERLEALTAALLDVQRQSAQHFDLLERLAPTLARSALEKLFVAPYDRSARVESLLLRQLARYRGELAVGIRVSPHDFPDATTLPVLRTAANAPAIALAIDPSLPTGSAAIDFAMGMLDVSMPDGWAAISAALEQMALAQ